MKLPPGYVEGKGVVKPTAYGGYGERMLRSLGWQTGKGLGKDEQGRKEAIEVKQKEDTIGLGGGPSVKWDDTWWESAFNDAVNSVKMNESSSDSDSDSEESPRSQKHRFHRDGTLASASAQELALLEHLSKSEGKVSVGRFGGRDGKMARIRAQEEMEAKKAAEKLGMQAGSDSSDLTHSPSSDDSEQNNRKSKKRKMNGIRENDDVGKHICEKVSQNDRRKARIVIEVGAGMESGNLGRPAEYTRPPDGWWGCKMFESVGTLAGADLERPVDRVRGFNEDQQTQIYNAAQMGKVTGKLGLGKGKRGTIKVGGSTWQGKKTVFDEEDGENVDVGKKRGGDTVQTRENKGKDMIKWKKIILKLIKKNGGQRMKMKDLKVAVKDFLLSKHGLELSKESLKAGINKGIAKNGKLLTEGKYILMKR